MMLQGHLKKVRYYLIFSLVSFPKIFIHDTNIRHKHGRLNIWIEIHFHYTGLDSTHLEKKESKEGEKASAL